MAVQYDEVEHKLQSLPHPSATADMLLQEQQEDINLVAHSFRYRNRRYSVVHSFRIFLGTQKLPCFLTFPNPVLVPKNCVIFIGCNFESRASQVGLHRQKKVCCVNKRLLQSALSLACVASVSNRVIARKLEREQKRKGAWKGEGDGERGEEETAFPSFPSPSPSPVNHFFPLLSQFSRRTRAETLTTQASLFNNPTLVPWYLIGLLPLKQDIPINCHQKYHLGLLND